ncbi:SHOCT domain-containing protein [Nocardioides aquiterrae]|uniref:SHOCT domain-containing protein n=1 Tax=Nocardioides aquiterrae TaxID=203799 RepID=A0ABP4F8P6_9ACTN
MMGWYGDGVGWGGWLVMSLSMIAFWALVVFAVVAIFRTGREDGSGRPGRRDPLEILDERFARGEIDETEYRARADVLRTSAH